MAPLVRAKTVYTVLAGTHEPHSPTQGSSLSTAISNTYIYCARQDSNRHTSGSKPRALSNCATGAQTNRREFTGKSLPVKLCIKNNGTGREIQLPDKCRRLGCAVFTVHVLVFPFHRQGALILNFI